MCDTPSFRHAKGYKRERVTIPDICVPRVHRSRAVGEMSAAGGEQQAASAAGGEQQAASAARLAAAAAVVTAGGLFAMPTCGPSPAGGSQPP